MVNISIISKCNNNCKYCFQQDSYHNSNQMLTYDEIEDILQWSKNATRVALLGGEPLLHPDILKIIKRCHEEFYTVIFSNILGNTNLLEEILKAAPKMNWLVNTTTRDELKDLFEKNIQLFKKYNKKISAGITLMMDEEYDERSIKNLVRLGKEYPDIIENYRLGLATPFHKNKVELLCYDEPVLKFCKLAHETTPDIPTSFDCPTNNCQVSPKVMAQLIEDYRVVDIKMIGMCSPVMDVMPNKSVKYCSSCPDGFLEVRNYKEFRNWLECEKHMLNMKNQYLAQHSYYCMHEKKDCINAVCNGICSATTEYLRRQMEGQS